MYCIFVVLIFEIIIDQLNEITFDEFVDWCFPERNEGSKGVTGKWKLNKITYKH